MARISIIIGIGMMLAGALGYTLAHTQSTTALIPSFIGIFMSVSGLLAQQNPKLRPLLMHLNTILAVIAMLGAASRVPYAMLEPKTYEVQLISLAYIVFLGATYLFLAIQSFIQARMKESYAPKEA